MADFGGWEMPIEYPVASGGGVINEHTAVRERVGLFDVSHLGKVRVSGSGAKEFLNSMLTNDLNRISAGRAQYTMMCNESGGVVDDLIAYLISDNEVFLVPNAANTSEVVRILKSNAPKDIQIEDCHEKYGVLALQGPLAAETLLSIVSLPELDYMSFLEIELGGYSVIICRTGYTGEFGYEIIPKWSETESVWNLLLQAIAAKSGLVAGLGARDTLRTEMCYPLHGHELSLEISPIQASASWAVGWKKEKFLGRDRLLSERQSGPTRVLRALRLTDRGVPRAEMEIYSKAGRLIGKTTSGTFSPTLKTGIALALLDPSLEIGSEIDVDIRGKKVGAVIAPSPLVASHVK